MCFFQHRVESLCYAMWADNNIVRTLSNFHSPKILAEGLNRKRKVDGVRERAQTPVPCPQQNQDYSHTFHLIDKGNGAEAKYDLKVESHTHGWTPKISARLFNMTLNNAYKIYVALVEKYTPNRRYLDMGEAVAEAAHAFLQQGAPMRTRMATHPPFVRDLTSIFCFPIGNKLRSDASGVTASVIVRKRDVHASLESIAAFKKKQKKHEWHRHQSIPDCKRGRCSYWKCPGLKSTTGRKRRQNTQMKCEECTVLNGAVPVYF